MGAPLTVIGWGNTTMTGRSNDANELRELQVPVVSDAQCDPAYGGGVVVEVELCAWRPTGRQLPGGHRLSALRRRTSRRGG